MIRPVRTDDPTLRVEPIFRLIAGPFFSDPTQSGRVRVGPKLGLTRPVDSPVTPPFGIMEVLSNDAIAVYQKKKVDLPVPPTCIIAYIK